MNRIINFADQNYAISRYYIKLKFENGFLFKKNTHPADVSQHASLIPPVGQNSVICDFPSMYFIQMETTPRQ